MWALLRLSKENHYKETPVRTREIRNFFLSGFKIWHRIVQTSTASALYEEAGKKKRFCSFGSYQRIGRPFSALIKTAPVTVLFEGERRIIIIYIGLPCSGSEEICFRAAHTWLTTTGIRSQKILLKFSPDAKPATSELSAGTKGIPGISNARGSVLSGDWIRGARCEAAVSAV